jgi:hypothetical protein
MRFRFALAPVAVSALTLSACFDESDDNWITGASPNPPAAANQAPSISGIPPRTIVEGEFYEFMPSAADPDGDALAFAISRKPGWATFDRATGRLSGTPEIDDVGNFTNIAITVSDGKATASLGNFDITVDAIAFGSATLSWNPPTENDDGSTLTDLAGYRIHYGRDPNQLTRTVIVSNPGLTRYVVENLAPANWHFTMTSVNSNGVESSRSPTVSKTIS